MNLLLAGKGKGRRRRGACGCCFDGAWMVCEGLGLGLGLLEMAVVVDPIAYISRKTRTGCAPVIVASVLAAVAAASLRSPAAIRIHPPRRAARLPPETPWGV